MAHVSLYRRFRPDSFDKMVRQEHVVTVLKNQIKADAVGHAYLFCGPRGTGKTSVARIFARAVNCLHPKDGSPCGTCEICNKLSEGSLDVTEIDAASNNGVNEMRELRDKVQYPPVTGRYKVYIIDEVHMLTDSAFNALLKTLEEPPAHAIFVLATTEPQKIPATILSRCMRLDFRLIPQEDLEAHLKRVLDEIGKPYEEEAVAAIARAGAGSDRDMLSIAETCIAYADKLTYEGVTAALGAADFGDTCALVGAVLRADMPVALSQTEKILAEGKSVGVLLRDLLQLLNQVAVVKLCSNARKLLSLPKQLFLQVEEIAKSADGHAVLRATEVFSATETELKFVSSPRICLETAIMKAAMPQADYNIDALLARMSALENKVTELLSSPVAVSSAPAVQPAQLVPAEKSKREEAQSEEQYFAEEPVFDEAYFSDEPISSFAEPLKTVRASAPKTPAMRQEEAKQAPKPTLQSAPVAPVGAEKMTAEAAYGKFIRTLRKTSRNGVLFTMCSDLEAVYEGDQLVLYTDIGTVQTALNREDHRKVMAEVFAQIGVSAFDVRLKDVKNQATQQKQGIEQLKRDFSEYPIEIK